MPLHQHLDGGHGEREARLKRRPAPMHDLFDMALRHAGARVIVWQVYRPDRLCHQPYPPQMCGQVTTGTAPADTGPTGPRRAPAPCGHGVSASLRRRRGGRAGLVHSGARALNVVTPGTPQRRRGVGHKGTGAGTGACHAPVMDRQRARRPARTAPRRVPRVDRGQPVSRLLGREASRQAAQRGGGDGGGKQRTPVWQGSAPGCHSPRRARAQPALRCLGTSLTEASGEQGRPMAVDVFPGCDRPRQGLAGAGVACHQQGTGRLTGPSHGL
jgi:hypothetical protein